MGRYRGRRRRWPLYLGLSLGACGLFIGLVLVFGVGPYDLPAQSRRLDAVIEESKRLGLPMTQADLKPESPIPEDQNAAPDVVRLAEEFSRSQRLLDPSYLNLDTTERAELEEAVTKVGPHLDGIVTALETKPGWSIDRDYDLAQNLLFPEYANFKSVAKYLASRAVLRADGGDAEGAVRDLRAARDLRQRFASEPVLIAFLSAVAIDSIALRASEEVMDAFGDDPEVLGQIEAMLKETVLGALADAGLETTRFSIILVEDLEPAYEAVRQIGLFDLIRSRWQFPDRDFRTHLSEVCKEHNLGGRNPWLDSVQDQFMSQIIENPPEMAVKEWEEVPKGLNRKKFYQLSRQFILHEELSALFAKSHLMLEKDLMDNLSKIDNAYLIVMTGFFTLAPDSTTDILIVGNVNKKELAEVIGGYEKKLNREINYTVLPLKEFEYRREITDKFLYDILVNKRIVLVDKIGLDSTEGR